MCLPPLMTVTRSLISSTSLSLWEMKTMDLPSFFMDRRISKSCSDSCGVSTAVGSSSTRISAPLYIVLIISTRWASPTDISPTFLSGWTLSP